MQEFHAALETVGIHVSAEAARGAMDELGLGEFLYSKMMSFVSKMMMFLYQKR